MPNRAEDLQWADVVNGNIVLYTKQQQIDAFNKLLDNDEYLDSRRNNYAERYGGKYPFYHRFDVRLLQDVFTNIGKRRGTLQFSVDVLNASNLLNKCAEISYDI